MIIHIHMHSINGMLKLTQGQGHKVKGQGQICMFEDKKLLGLLVKNHERFIVS